VESIRISSSWEYTTIVLIDNEDFIIAYEIIDIFLVYDTCLECILDMMKIIKMLTHIDIFYSKELLHLSDTILCECCSLLFLIDLVVCIM
jgi:hypothetical protein